MTHARRMIRDTSKVTNLSVYIMGVAAGGAVSLVSTLLAALGLVRMDLEMLIGSSLTGVVSQESGLLGLAILLIASGFFAFGYAIIFRSAHRSGALVGINLCLFHYMVSGFLIGLLPVFHPLMPESLDSPGFFMVSAGFLPSVAFFLSHVLFGIVVGELFDKASIRGDYPQPLTSGSLSSGLETTQAHHAQFQ